MKRQHTEKITACPRFSVGWLFFGGDDGRRRGCINGDISGTTGFAFVSRRIRLFACFLVWFCFWLFPSSALAEFDSADSSNLNTIRVEVQSLEARQEWIFDYLVGALGGNMNSGSSTPYYVPAIYQQLQTLSSALGYTPTNTLDSKLSIMDGRLEDNLDYLQRIEDLLTLIESHLEGGTGSGSGSSDLPWAKETTLQTYSDNFQTYSDNFQSYYDFVKGGFIYGEGGTGNYNDYNLRQLLWYLNYGNYSGPNRSFSYRIYRGMDKGEFSPFPDSSYKFPKVEGLLQTVGGTFITPFERLGYILTDQSRYCMENDIFLAKKQAWNDWQAHTNLVSTLERLLDSTPPENSVSSTSDFGSLISSEQGGEQLNITYDKGTGDSGESIDLTPVYTNNVAQLTSDSTTITNDFNDIWNYSRIKERYIDESKISTSSYFNDVNTQDISSYTITYGTKPYMKYSWGGTSLRFYRAIFTYERLKLLRAVFGRMWQILVLWGCYVLFRILGKAND